MSDPVSWLVIEKGWRVVDSSGKDVGQVEEVIGDSGVDIFNGLSVATGLLSAARYVPAESVGEITEGTVHLTLSEDAVGELGEYEEPPPSEQFRAT
jgi:hypothetical protein